MYVGGHTILERVLTAIGPLASECLALVDDTSSLPALPGLRLLVDPQLHAGPLAALAHGLPVAAGEVCLLVGGDMPFVSRAAFEYLLRVQATESATAVVPYVDGHLQSLHSVVAREPLLAGIADAQRQGERRLFAVLQSLHPRLVEAEELRTIDPELRTLFNVNTPDDLALAEQIAVRQVNQDG